MTRGPLHSLRLGPAVLPCAPGGVGRGALPGAPNRVSAAAVPAGAWGLGFREGRPQLRTQELSPGGPTETGEEAQPTPCWGPWSWRVCPWPGWGAPQWGWGRSLPSEGYPATLLGLSHQAPDRLAPDRPEGPRGVPAGEGVLLALGYPGPQLPLACTQAPGSASCSVTFGLRSPNALSSS